MAKRKRIRCNQEYCIACGICGVVCSIAHNKDIENILFVDKTHKLQARSNVCRRDALSFMNACRNCAEAECLKACVSGAITRSTDGMIILDAEKCIGCWTCVMVCPNGAIMQYDDGAGNKHSLKCDLCAGRETPACVEHCPNNVLTVEELD